MIEYFLPMIVILGLYSSYTDIKTKKVSNKIIALSLIYAFIAMYFLGLANNTYIIGLALSILFSIALWYVGLWPAGDGKLFIAYSSLLPFLYDSYFGWARILLVLFAPLALVYVSRSLSRVKHYKAKIKQLITFRYIAENMITLFAIILISSLFVNALASIFISIVIRFLIRKTLKKAVLIALIASITALVINQPVLNLSIFQYMIIAFIIILVLDISKEDELSKKHIPLAPFMFIAVLVSILIFVIL